MNDSAILISAVTSSTFQHETRRREQSIRCNLQFLWLSFALVCVSFTLVCVSFALVCVSFALVSVLCPGLCLLPCSVCLLPWSLCLLPWSVCPLPWSVSFALVCVLCPGLCLLPCSVCLLPCSVSYHRGLTERFKVKYVDLETRTSRVTAGIFPVPPLERPVDAVPGRATGGEVTNDVPGEQR